MLYVLLTLLVVTGATQALDEAILHRLRPGDAWNDPQVRWSPWMSRLRPSRTYLLLAVTSVVVSLWRRSWWPSFLGLALAGVSGVVALATKVAVHRPDPHGYVTESGGAYPSGHTVTLVVGTGSRLRAPWPRVQRWRWRPPLVLPALLTALLLSGSSWVTDVLGAMLLALALVTGAAGPRCVTVPIRLQITVWPEAARTRSAALRVAQDEHYEVVRLRGPRIAGYRDGGPDSLILEEPSCLP